MHFAERTIPHIHFHRLAAGLILLAGYLLMLPCVQAHETSVIRNLTIDPAVIYVGVPCWVVVRASVLPDAALIKSRINLFRIDQNGATAIVDRLKKDGTVGALESESLYTNWIQFKESESAVIKLQVSAEYEGGRKELSEPFFLKVDPKPDLKAIEASWKGFVKKMVGKDLDGAAQYWMESERESFKKDMNETGMRKASAWYKTVRDSKPRILQPGVIEVVFKITLGWGKASGGTVAFRPDTDGVWRIHGTVFYSDET
jgi:hypothetical protein